MEQIKFLITNTFGNVPSETKNKILLIWDNWNDYSYYTAFGINYIDFEGETTEIGSVRIAYIGQKEGRDARKLAIGDNFERLDENYFSLGTDDLYYENLNLISDTIRDFVLKGLNDIALDNELLNKVIHEDVTRVSLLRDISYSMVVNQYRRIANGGARLTNYSFSYFFDDIDKSSIEFNVIAEHNPPTNIQIIIGSNGVGKSHLLNEMIDSVLLRNNDRDKKGTFIFNTNSESESFSNVICVTFSAFDEYEFHHKTNSDEIKYHYIGLKSLEQINKMSSNSINDFADEFTSSIGLILSSSKLNRWKSIIKELESDPIFEHENFIDFIDNYRAENPKPLQTKFARLSSGHKIILITITRLVELVQEKSLIFFDEPEIHLHPPLLASFTRAISKLLTNRNAVCLMTTHSPIVLQEVPSFCVYKLSRMGKFSKFERPDLETFGENIGVLTNEIFGLEVTESGFYKILKEIVAENNTYDDALRSIGMRLGIEGKSILRSLFFDKEN